MSEWKRTPTRTDFQVPEGAVVRRKRKTKQEEAIKFKVLHAPHCRHGFRERYRLESLTTTAVTYVELYELLGNFERVWDGITA